VTARGLILLVACCACSPPDAGFLLERQGHFFAGGAYAGTAERRGMAGQMYVQYQLPGHSRHVALVLIPGGGQTTTAYSSTPDGREGWTEYFLRDGFEVYVVDPIGRGNSGSVAAYGEQGRKSLADIERDFTATAEHPAWPQARLHEQWPGSGHEGDRAFDQFMAAQQPSQTDAALADRLNRDALVALLARIGPAIVIAHSRSGPFGWEVADARPDLVRALIELEPSGPPFENAAPATGPARPWGITSVPLNYDPPLTSPQDLRHVAQATPDAPDLVVCQVLVEPAPVLRRLQQVPILLVTAEASYHAAYDHCTSRFLRQAGVRHDFVRLADRGIHHNGHMFMLETNNLQIAGLLRGWILAHVRS
jgi:pimeloyl-ACP methyl ester carboxylesterase